MPADRVLPPTGRTSDDLARRLRQVGCSFTDASLREIQDRIRRDEPASLRVLVHRFSDEGPHHDLFAES